MPGAIGMIIIMVLLASAALGIFSSYVNYVGIIKHNADNAAATAAENVVLSVQGSTLYAANVGGREVQIQDLILVNRPGTVTEQPYTGTLMPGTQTVIRSSMLNNVLTPGFLSYGAVGIITTFGNIFWFGHVPTTTTASSPNYNSTCPITTVSVIPSGGGSVGWVGTNISGSTTSFEDITPTGGSCPMVTMTATQSNQTFNEWYVNGIILKNNPITINLAKANSIIAVFGGSGSGPNSLALVFTDVSGAPLQALSAPITVGVSGPNGTVTTQISPNSSAGGPYYIAQFTGLAPGLYSVDLPAFPYTMVFQGVQTSTGKVVQVNVPNVSNPVGNNIITVAGKTYAVMTYQTQVLSMNAYLDFGADAAPPFSFTGSPGTAVTTVTFSDNQYTNSHYAGYAVQGVFSMANQPSVTANGGVQDTNYTMLSYAPAEKDALVSNGCGACQGTTLTTMADGVTGQFSYIFIQGLGNDVVGGTTTVDCSNANNNFNCFPYLPVASVTEYIVTPANEVDKPSGKGTYSSTFTVVGQAFDASGNPISGAQITLNYSFTGPNGLVSKTATATTNANGYYEFTGITVIGSPATVSVSPSGTDISATITWNIDALSEVGVTVRIPQSASTPSINMVLAGAFETVTNGQTDYFDMMTSGSTYTYPFMFPVITVTTSSTNGGSSTTYCVPGSPGVWTLPPGTVPNEFESYTSC